MNVSNSDVYTAPIRALPPLIHTQLEEYCALRGREAERMDPRMLQAHSILTDFVLQGGKRMRPLFAWIGYLGAINAQPEQIAHSSDAIIRSIAALEFIQACALIHDDIIDGSDTRRGNPTVHRRYECIHSDGGFLGDAAEFGRSLGILIGDLALVYADDMVLDSGLDAAALQRIREPWRAMRHEVIGGQILDVSIEAAGVEGTEAPEKVNRYKTAAYTIERPLHLGGALAGADPEIIAAYRSYGTHLGIAFQLRDEILGVFGDPQITGKPAGDDLREGKRTVLVARALERLDATAPSHAATLRAGLGQVNAEHDIAELARLIQDSGAVEDVEARIRELKDTALAAISVVPSVADLLRDMAERATARRM